MFYLSGILYNEAPIWPNGPYLKATYKSKTQALRYVSAVRLYNNTFGSSPVSEIGDISRKWKTGLLAVYQNSFMC